MRQSRKRVSWSSFNFTRLSIKLSIRDEKSHSGWSWITFKQLESLIVHVSQLEPTNQREYAYKSAGVWWITSGLIQSENRDISIWGVISNLFFGDTFNSATSREIYLRCPPDRLILMPPRKELSQSSNECWWASADHRTCCSRRRCFFLSLVRNDIDVLTLRNLLRKDGYLISLFNVRDSSNYLLKLLINRDGGFWSCLAIGQSFINRLRTTFPSAVSCDRSILVLVPF